MKFEEVKLPNPGIIQFRIPNNVFLPVQKNLLSLDLSSAVLYNNSLVGQIENEIKYTCPASLKFFLLEAAKTFCDNFNYHNNSDIALAASWVNFQKKFEYNPIHKHHGIISFIVFVKIPYQLSNEDKLHNTKNAGQHTNGRLSFVYNSMFNNLSEHTIDVDSSYEGVLLMFPNTAHHCVYPFYTSDEFRITISGNFTIVRD